MRVLLTMVLLCVGTVCIPKESTPFAVHTQQTYLKEIHFERQVGRTDCYATCKRILGKVSVSCGNRGTELQLLLEEGNSLRKTGNDGISAIDSMLFLSLPVVVGVHHTLGYGYNEGTTDHFVVVVEKGMDSEGIYYRFFDVASKHGSSKSNKFRAVNGILIHHSKFKKYVCTQIRFSRSVGSTPPPSVGRHSAGLLGSSRGASAYDKGKVAHIS